MLCVALVNIKFMRYVAVNDTFKVLGAGCHGRDRMVLQLFYIFTTTCAISASIWCLTPLSTICQLFHGGVLLLEETIIPEKTTNLSQVTTMR
jgi:hypothetical protein